MTQVCAHVIGNDAAVGFAGSQGHFELNVYKPMMAYRRAAIDAASGRTRPRRSPDNCVPGIEPDAERIEQLMRESLMLVTALAPRDRATTTPRPSRRAAHRNRTTLREEAVKLGFVDEETFDRVVRPETMTGPK